MSVQQVDKSGWTIFFDTFTRTLVGKRAEIEVAWLELVDSDGTSQIVKLKDPLALSGPSGHAKAEPTG